MRHVYVPVVFLFCVASFALGQEYRADLFGGYSYVNIDTNGLSNRQNANGWEASLSGNFNKWFAVEGDVSGYYKSYDVFGVNVAVSDYSYVAGPRFNFKPLFLHALLGGDHLSGGALGLSAAQDSLAGAFGGGVQWKFARQLSLRTSADYAFTRHNILGGSSVTQNNFRVSVGLVYSLGAVRPAEPTPAEHHVPGATVPALGITVADGEELGARIVDVLANGPGALAGLHPGDVINSVNGNPVRTPAEVVGALSSLAPGSKVRLGYLINGQWQTEKPVFLGNP